MVFRAFSPYRYGDSMTKWIIIHTATSKAIEQIYGFHIIGKELMDADFYYPSHVRGYVEVEGPYPLMSIRRQISLPSTDVIPFHPKPLDQVLAEAKERSLK